MDSNATIEFRENESGGRFYLGDYAKMTFVNNPKAIISVDHTWVSPDHRGEGLAQELYQAMINYAAQHQLKIIPLCSYVQNMFERRPQDQYLLATALKEDD